MSKNINKKLNIEFIILNNNKIYKQDNQEFYESKSGRQIHLTEIINNEIKIIKTFHKYSIIV